MTKSEGDNLYLELYHPDGDLQAESVEIKKIINREADTIKVSRGGEFTRVMP